MNRVETGLKVALILFVIIAIVLGITTWTFKKQYDEAVAERKTAMEKASVDAAAASSAKEDIEVLKRLIGYSDDVSIIGEKFKEAMQQIAPEAENPTYVSVISSLQDKLGTYIKDLELKTKSLAALTASYSTNEAQTAKVLATAKERVAVADKRIAELEKKHAEALESNAGKVATTIASTNTARKRDEGRVKEANVRVEMIEKVVEDTNQKLEDALDKLREHERPPVDNPQGKILLVDTRGDRGTINLGSAANVTRGLTFSVYDRRDMSEQGLKGNVEVIKIENARTSEVRIDSLDMDNPIVSDDVIYTPNWWPGFQTHYALLGKMDVKGNDQHDLATVRSLVAKNGGVIDAYQRDDGAPEGIIDNKTTTIILGTPPDEKSPGIFRDTYSNMIAQAERLRIRQVQLTEFLKHAGYNPNQDRSDNVRSNPSRPRTTSTGNIAGIYGEDSKDSETRRPRGGSAY